ncbi:MAG: hypothetical protein ACREIF_02220 [Chthoniobacterales bacterium]
MKRLIPSAFFSAKFAELVRIRARRHPDGVNLPEAVGDVQPKENCWEAAADGFTKSDPDGARVRALMAELEKAN